MSILADVFSRYTVRLRKSYPTIDTYFRIRRTTDNDLPYAVLSPKSGWEYAVDVSPQLAEQSRYRIEGVFAHLLGHAVLLHLRVDHTERDADRLVEEMFGLTVSYDHEDCPTTKYGVSPRPFYLENDSKKACLCHLPTD